jgi:hypothetical protein
MTRYSTREAAKKLGLSHNALAVYVRTGKVPAPENVRYGGNIVHIWTDDEIEHVRKLLPKIANGRKTRYQKLRGKQNKTPARASQSKPKPHKKK